LEEELIRIPDAPSHNLPVSGNKVKPSASKSKNGDEIDELRKMAEWANT